MTGTNNIQSCRYEISETNNNEIIVYFIGELSIETSASILSELIIIFNKDIPSSLTIDLGNVTYFDESVQGLDKDSPVKYRGVSIGRVENINVAPDAALIQVVLKIESGLESGIDDIVARLKSVGITGIMFV
jgi:hypothetical protein